MRIDTLNDRVIVSCAILIDAAVEIPVHFNDQYVNEGKMTQL